MSDTPATASDPTLTRPVKAVPKWAIHRRMYEWVLSFANHKHSTTALGAISFAESSFFPIPPDVLLAPLCMGNRSKAWWFATVCTVASVVGGLAGYAIGYGAWEATSQIWFDYVPGFTEDKFAKVEGLYNEYGFWVIFIAAFTPIPYKVFTIAGGVFHQALLPFVLASLVGRGLRFFAVAAIFRWVGPKAQPFIDRYFNLLCIAFTLLLIGGFALLKLVQH
jgi:membrane protein YqaA with SNARE-associated domain